MRWLWQCDRPNLYLDEGDVVDVQLSKYWLVDRAQTRQAQRRSKRLLPTVVQLVRALSITCEGNLRATARHCRHTRGSGGHRYRLFGDAAYHVQDIDNVLIWPAAPVITVVVPPNTGWRASQNTDSSRSGQRTATVTQCPTPKRWWSPSRSRVKPPTPWRIASCSRSGHDKYAHHLQCIDQRYGARMQLYITRAGIEIGVASTKAFTAQLAGLFL